MRKSDNTRTLPAVANELGISYGNARYLVMSRAIRPSCKFGNAAVYTDADVDIIKTELAAIRRKQAARGAK